jgi:hypothetical protein
MSLEDWLGTVEWPSATQRTSHRHNTAQPTHRPRSRKFTRHSVDRFLVVS